MKSYFSDRRVRATLEEMSPLWFNTTFKIDGPAIVAAIGTLRVLPLTKSGHIAKRYLPLEMLHVVCSLGPMSASVFSVHQYFFAAVATECLGIPFQRKDRLIMVESFKVSVFKALYFPQTPLIYMGFCLDRGRSDLLPITTFKVPVQEFAIDFMQTYAQEISAIQALTQELVL